jgi:hypothetical protein
MGKHIVEIIEVKGRKFHIVPTRPKDKNTSWRPECSTELSQRI